MKPHQIILSLLFAIGLGCLISGSFLAKQGVPDRQRPYELTVQFLDFGPVFAGDDEKRRFGIINNTATDLWAAFTDTCDAFEIFGYQDGDPYLVPGGQTVTFEVLFSPDAVQEYDCSLGLGYPELPPVHLLGTGMPPPECVIEPAWLDFGHVPLHEFADRVFTITNQGIGTLVDSVSVPTGDFSIITGGDPFELETGQEHLVGIRFTPTELGPQEMEVEVSFWCEPVVCHAKAIKPSLACELSRDRIEFRTSVPGASFTESFTIINAGNGLLSGEVALSSDHFRLAEGAGPFLLAPEQELEVQVVYSPAGVGNHHGVVTTGTELCPEVLCTGRAVEFSGGRDLLGIYFDSDAGSNVHRVSELMEQVTAYLVVVEPSQLSGIGGYECCVEMLGGNVAPWWTLPDGFSNADESPCFDVSLEGQGSLPWQFAVVLGQVDFFQGDPDDPTRFFIHPGSDPSLPNTPLYRAGDDLDLLIPLTPSSGGEGNAVAWVLGPDSVDIVATTPEWQWELDGMRLWWNCPGIEVDGFHVYRRLAGEAVPGRVTGLPLAAPGAGEGEGHGDCEVRFHDRAGGMVSGTVLYYSYGMVRGGGEIGRSPEVRAVWGDALPRETILFPNSPNPFNPVTWIRFELSRGGSARLEIFDLAGRQIRTLVDGFLPAAVHEFQWDGRDAAGRMVASGSYYYRLVSDGFNGMGRMVLLK